MRTRCSVALLSLSFLSIKRPIFSSVEAGLHISDGESSGNLDSKKINQNGSSDKVIKITKRVTHLLKWKNLRDKEMKIRMMNVRFIGEHMVI